MADKKENTDAKHEADEGQEIKFHYIKAPSYRSIFIDGAHGGMTPKGLLCMNVFQERPPIPQNETFRVGKDGLELVGHEGKEGVIRQVEASILMDYNTMKAVKQWLDNKIETFEQLYLNVKDKH